jgi:hypothetical protein
MLRRGRDSQEEHSHTARKEIREIDDVESKVELKAA